MIVVEVRVGKFTFSILAGDSVRYSVTIGNEIASVGRKDFLAMLQVARAMASEAVRGFG